MNKLQFHRIVIVVLVLLNAFLVYRLVSGKHQHHHRRSMEHASGPKYKIIKKLDFDEKQVADFEVLIAEHQRKIKQFDQEIIQVKQEIYHQLNEGQPQVQDSLYQEIGRLQVAIEQAHFEHFLAIKALCREDQLARFEALSKRLSKIFSKRHGGRKPHRRPN